MEKPTAIPEITTKMNWQTGNDQSDRSSLPRQSLKLLNSISPEIISLESVVLLHKQSPALKPLTFEFYSYLLVKQILLRLFSHFSLKNILASGNQTEGNDGDFLEHRPQSLQW